MPSKNMPKVPITDGVIPIDPALLPQSIARNNTKKVDCEHIAKIDMEWLYPTQQKTTFSFIEKNDTMIAMIDGNVRDKLKEVAEMAHVPRGSVELFVEAASKLLEIAVDNGVPKNCQFELTNSRVVSPISLPEKSPELYVPNGPESAEEFYWRVWGKYADAGILYQDILRKYDESLVKALRNRMDYIRRSRNKDASMVDLFKLATIGDRTEMVARECPTSADGIRAKKNILLRGIRHLSKTR